MFIVQINKSNSYKKKFDKIYSGYRCTANVKCSVLEIEKLNFYDDTN